MSSASLRGRRTAQYVAALDFIEEQPDVDYVTDFRCGLAGAGELLVNDVAEIVADRPDVILVSAARHVIGEATD